MKESSDRHDLELMIKSRTPIIVIETYDERTALQLLTDVSLKLYRPLHLWTVSDGLRRHDVQLDKPGKQTEPDEALNYVKLNSDNGIYVFADLHPFLKDPLHIRLLKDIALKHDKTGQTVVLLSHRVELPPDLKRLAVTTELALPSEEQLQRIVQETATEWQLKTNTRVSTDKRTYESLIRSMKGLTANDARRLVRRAIFDDGLLSGDDIDTIHRAKHALLSPEGALSFEFDTASLGEVGGMERFKGWLKQRGEVVRGDDSSLTPPKGVLLLGVQGGGKSLAAKAVAGMWQLPLMRLDFGALYSKWSGESEHNLREALRTADAMTPCVLWMDEIEKGISTGDSDGGTSQRLLGTLLTWMAEQRGGVFLVATANDITRLPAELVRKGRFDEIFFVDLPSREVRELIFRIHLHKRDLNSQHIDIGHLAAISAGFSGAEIEQAVVDALYHSRAEQREPDGSDIEQVLSNTNPLSIVMREQIDGLRRWASERAVPASDKGPYD